jgi:hypothetical protein
VSVADPHIFALDQGRAWYCAWPAALAVENSLPGAGRRLIWRETRLASVISGFIDNNVGRTVLLGTATHFPA